MCCGLKFTLWSLKTERIGRPRNAACLGIRIDNRMRRRQQSSRVQRISQAFIFFRGKPTHVSYSVHSLEDVLLRVLIILQNHVAVGKRRNIKTTKKEQPTAQTGGVHNDQHRAVCTPHSTLCIAVYFIVFRRMRLTHSAVVNKAYVKRWNLNEVTTPARNNWHKQEQAASRSSVEPKIERVRFGSCEERRPRDASPVSVVFGVDRGRVFGIVAARTTSSATSAAAAAAAAAVLLLLCGFLSSQAQKNMNTGFVRTRKLSHAAKSPRETLMAIN